MKAFAWAVLLGVACLLMSCDRSSSKPATTTGTFRVAMILPGSDTDQGWNQLAREGLERIGKELGAETKLVTNVASSDVENRAEYFAHEGFDVVICHGGEYGSSVAKVAASHPKTKFIVGGSADSLAGVTTVEFLARDASQLVGVVAAQVSKTKKVGFVGAFDYSTIVACYDGMKVGVAEKDASVTVLPAQWTGDWGSATLAKEKAEVLLRGGADVVYQNVDAAARGVFEAVKAANSKEHPAYAFGCNRNQNDLAPEVILGSVVIDVPRAYADLARQAKEGKLAGGAMKLGLPDGYVDLVLNDKHPSVSAGIRQSVQDARQRLLKGNAPRAGAK